VAYPSRAYRNPLPRLLGFLRARHGDDGWCIFEFRAEGTGYADEEVGGRIRHFPWPDHHPPPFALLVELLDALREWFGDGWWEGPALTAAECECEGEGEGGGGGHDENEEGQPPAGRRAAVLHCKAGKGRSGTTACAYLVAARGWPAGAALARFTARRMRPGWGAEGVSIRSQRRWVAYAERWARGTPPRAYDAGLRVRVVEVRAWGVRDNVSVSVRGFVDGGRRIKVLARWGEGEGEVVPLGAEEGADEGGEEANPPRPLLTPEEGSTAVKPWLYQQWQQWQQGQQQPSSPGDSPRSSSSNLLLSNPAPRNLVVLRPSPSAPILLPTPDVNVEIERRSRSLSSPLVTSTAHSWFNVFFEAGAPENAGVPARKEGVYEVAWDGMDGLKGSSQRGLRAVERVAVVWEIVSGEEESGPSREGEEEGNGEEEDKEKVAIEDDRSEEGVQSYGVKGDEV
jgi:hypothetical protein